MIAFVGIDGGATHAVALATDATGHALARAQADAIVLRGADHENTIDAIAGLVHQVLALSGTAAPAAAIACGLTGGGRRVEQVAFETMLRNRGLAGRILVTSDAEAAFADAFGDDVGILLIAGTGSIAWGRGPAGVVARTGGWGPVAGDEGSAWALGQATLRAVLAAHDGRADHTLLTEPVLASAGVDDPPALVRWAENAGKKGIAALAPIALQIAASDAVARSICETAARDLARHVTALVARLSPWPGTIPIALAGGLLARGRPLRDAVQERIRLAVPSAAFLDDDVDGARGAARLARALVS
jgi:glucosamine kinase